MADYVIAEKSQRNPNEKPWWWLSGNTYPHRHLLKQQGARFSGKRRAWYFIGWELPAPIRQLLAFELEPAPVLIETDSAPALADLKEAISPIDVNNTEVVSNNVNAERDQGAADESPAPISDTPNHVFISTGETAIQPEEPPATKAPTVRVIKPSSVPRIGDSLDAMQNAIQEVKALPPMPEPVSVPSGSHRLLPIKQTCCGELTGSITGQVFCYGYAIYGGICVCVNMGGPRTSVEAIRAKLGKGDIVTLVPDDAPAIELTAGEGNSGMYTDYLQTIPEARFTSLILLHEWVVHPSDDAAATFLLRVSDAQAKTKLKHLVMKLVNIPVFDAWTEFLWTAGHSAALVRRTQPAGGIDLLTVSRDASVWTRLITSGIEQAIIQLPQTH